MGDDLELAVTEVVTNAVIHGDAAKGSRVHVSYRLTKDRLRVEVRDRATGTPTPARRGAPDGDLAENGYGLPVLTAITDLWGVTPHVIGKSVWFEIERPSAYGYMRAYDATPDEEIRADEQRLRMWAAAEGYVLATVYQEVVAGGITELTALIAQMRRTGVRTVVVPSVEHLGNGRFLQEHVWAEIVGRTDAEVHEAREAEKAPNGSDDSDSSDDSDAGKGKP
ncbi:hypothetical protein BGM09_26015 [Streptomyces sp. CBMA29]|nr:hypothetical protein [Streptomyces sp. CBMA29]